MSKKSIYKEVTARIIEQLEKGVLPWRRPYGVLVDRNGYTGRRYKGINLILLAMSSIKNGFNSPLWLTFNEAHKLGGYIKKGEKGTKIIFWKFWEKVEKDEEGNPIIDPETGEPVTVEIPFARWYTVFNLEQIENITLPEKFNINPPDPTPLREALFSLPVIIPGKIPAYVPEKDVIQMPLLSTFKNPDDFWVSYFHELVHWSGAPQRLNRNLSTRFGDAAYAFEELIAEIGSAFLCRHTGINTDCYTASYIDSWIRRMKKDSKAIFTAARKAQEAVDWLLEQADAKQLRQSA